MSTEPTPQTASDAIQYAQWVHCEQMHGVRLQIDQTCPTCLALARAVQAAQPAPATTQRSHA